MKTRLAWIVPVLLVGWNWSPGAAAGTEEPAAEAEARPDDGGWQFWFFALEEYRLRAQTADAAGGSQGAGDQNDHDMRFFLESGFRDPSDRWGAEAALGLWWDVDGEVPEGGAEGLGSVYDYRQPWWDVFTLQADYRSTGILKLARAGRQPSEHGIPVTFDGASLELAASKPYLDIFVFGGRTVHFFETRAEAFEDWIGSAGAVIRPMPDLKLELDYRLHIEDAQRELDGSDQEIRDHSYGLTAHYRHDDWLLLRAYLRGLDDSPSHAGVAARLVFSSLGMGVDAGLDGQLVTLDEINEQDDPYFALLGESLPHLRWRIDVWKAYETSAGDYSIHAGWNGREVVSGEVGPFNRNVGRLYLMAQATDIGIQGPFASLAAEGHYTHTDFQLDGDWVLTAGGSAGWECQKLRAEVGTFYQRYKYDYYRDAREVDDVRTVFVSAAVKPLTWLRLRARYEYEISDRDVHTVWVTVSQSY